MTSRSGPCWPVAGSWIIRIARTAFLMRQGRREFPLGLRTVLACLAFAEREGAVPELPADWWVNINRRYQ